MTSRHKVILLAGSSGLFGLKAAVIMGERGVTAMETAAFAYLSAMLAIYALEELVRNRFR